MVKLLIFAAFVIQFVLFWSWLLHRTTDITLPPERI